MLVNKKLILCYIVAVSSFLNAMKLSEIPQLNKLENYNEIKNVEVERVVDYDNYDRNGKYVYVHGETIPFSVKLKVQHTCIIQMVNLILIDFIKMI